MREIVASIVVLAVLSTAPRAFAQSKPPQSEADRLFEEALSLLDAGKYEEACAKLEASHKVDPAPGTLLSLGDCYAKAGKTASAWRSFREAGEFARRIGDAERTKVASDRAAALEPALAKLTITVEKSDAPVTVKRDGTIIEPAVWGVPVPLDPAFYAIEATAPGRVPFSSKVELREPGKTITVAVPVLALPAPVVVPPPARTEDKPFLTPRKTLAAGIGVLGLVALGTGGYFALKADSNWSDARTRCIDGEPLRCSDSDAAEQARSAGTQADIATVSIGIGVVALGAAVVLWLTDPERSR